MASQPNNLRYLLEQASFLILDDVLTFRTQLIQDIRTLKIRGTIHEAADIKSAYEILNQKKIDFIIADWNLPDGSGHDFLLNVRKIPAHKKTPFLIWTTRNEVTDIIKGINAGANEYFCKPWTQEELEIKIMQAWTKVHGPQKM